jgi:outer membrane protein insertion porin family
LTEGSISNLYLDNGYVFFKTDFTTDQKPHRVFDITITVYEGLRAKFGLILVKGNKTIPTSEILKNISIKTGDVFSKKEIINSIKAIAAMNKFDPEKIYPSLTPIPENATNEFGHIDIVFEVTENDNK